MLWRKKSSGQGRLLEKGELEADPQKVSVWGRTACGDSTGKVDFISTGI